MVPTSTTVTKRLLRTPDSACADVEHQSPHCVSGRKAVGSCAFGSAGLFGPGKVLRHGLWCKRQSASSTQSDAGAVKWRFQNLHKAL